MSKVRIEIHLTEKETTILDQIASADLSDPKTMQMYLDWKENGRN